MRIEVTLPDLGEDSVAEVHVSGWLAEVGAALESGDDLLEITTDKAAFSVPCPQNGVLQATNVKPGQDIRVGDVICVLEVQ